MPSKEELLSQTIEHIDITKHNVVGLVESMRHMAYSARDLARAADIYDRMLRDKECGIILCLAGSLISAGLRGIFVEMIRSRMIDCIVSTGANIVDQDFFEALGYRHYMADERLKAGMNDDMLRELHIDRIYDTLIDEDELRICDDTTRIIADELPARPHSSREFIQAMGAWLVEQGKGEGSIVRTAFEHDVPDILPGVFRLLGRLRPGGPSACPRRSAQSVHRQRERFLRADAVEDQESHDGHFHARRRRAQELHARYRGGRRHPGRGAADAQIRRAGHRGRRARRRPIEQHAQGSLQLGQGRHGLRANGVQRSHAGPAADRRLRLAQRRLEEARSEALQPLAGAGECSAPEQAV